MPSLPLWFRVCLHIFHQHIADAFIQSDVQGICIFTSGAVRGSVSCSRTHTHFQPSNLPITKRLLYLLYHCGTKNIYHSTFEPKRLNLAPDSSGLNPTIPPHTHTHTHIHTYTHTHTLLPWGYTDRPMTQSYAENPPPQSIRFRNRIHSVINVITMETPRRFL